MNRQTVFTAAAFTLYAVSLGAISAFAAPISSGLNDYYVPKSSIARPGSCHTDILVLRHGSSGLLGRPTSSAVSGIPGFETAESLKKIYNIPSNLKGSGAIAVVDAYDDPQALSDFNTYSRVGGYPVETSTNPFANTNKVFQLVYSTGHKPGPDPLGPLSWDLEESLDMEIAHATAPNAKIYVVETPSQNLSDLVNGVKVAESLPGVKQISCSWGYNDSADTDVYDSAFVAPGISIFASTGDGGVYLAGYPSISPNVIAVGGTTIQRSKGKFVGEIGWVDGGGGVSVVEPKPAYQDAVNPTGQFRTIPDISADADPNSGVTLIDTLYPADGIWFDVGGTSLSSPFIAALTNLASVKGQDTSSEHTSIYTALGTDKLRDITIGFNGYGGNQGYEAGPGYDLVTGVGVPNGLGAL